jgi:hypothetical protein
MSRYCSVKEYANNRISNSDLKLHSFPINDKRFENWYKNNENFKNSDFFFLKRESTITKTWISKIFLCN